MVHEAAAGIRRQAIERCASTRRSVAFFDLRGTLKGNGLIRPMAKFAAKATQGPLARSRAGARRRKAAMTARSVASAEEVRT
jgi:hypothetical protein